MPDEKKPEGLEVEAEIDKVKSGTELIKQIKKENEGKNVFTQDGQLPFQLIDEGEALTAPGQKAEVVDSANIFTGIKIENEYETEFTTDSKVKREVDRVIEYFRKGDYDAVIKHFHQYAIDHQGDLEPYARALETELHATGMLPTNRYIDRDYLSLHQRTTPGIPITDGDRWTGIYNRRGLNTVKNDAPKDLRSAGLKKLASATRVSVRCTQSDPFEQDI